MQEILFATQGIRNDLAASAAVSHPEQTIICSLGREKEKDRLWDKSLRDNRSASLASLRRRRARRALQFHLKRVALFMNCSPVFICLGVFQAYRFLADTTARSTPGILGCRSHRRGRSRNWPIHTDTPLIAPAYSRIPPDVCRPSHTRGGRSKAAANSLRLRQRQYAFVP